MSSVWLVAHDFSPCSDAALAHAGKLASASGAKLSLLHAHADLRVQHERQDGSATYATEQAIRDKLKAAAAKVQEDFPNLEVETAATMGPPADTILEEADRLNAEMVVVGTHGRKGLSLLVMGSVAERVTQRCMRPVLVVKAK
jgi:nucleotide-binding universal stress UspA family protein